MLVVDLFSGVGGLSLGFTQAGFEVVFANEYDKNIAQAYQKNHPKAQVDSRDIRNIDFDTTFKEYKNKIAVVIGGPPCQGFSQKGKRIGVDDDRNFMFQQFVNAIKVISPKYFILENVPNILSAENGYFKEAIIESFEKIGYEINAKILKAENFGVPQTRRRAIFLGKKNGLDFELPDGNNKRTTLLEAISDLPVLKSGEGYDGMLYKSDPTNEYQKFLRKNSKLVSNHISTRHSDLVLERLAIITIEGGKEDLPSHHRTKSIHSGTWMRLNPNGYAPTITTRFDTPSSGQFTLPYQDRCLTVREAARVQSFPDNFIFYGGKSCQMLQVGNAVPPLLSFEIAKTIKNNF
jgi:DNA (cytosine-5)-methyltransferase 1